MQNPEEIINDAAVLLECYARTHDTAVTIGVLEGSLSVLFDPTSEPNFKPIMHLTKWQLHNGLTSRQWDTIGDKAVKLIKEYEQCQTHHKH